MRLHFATCRFANVAHDGRDFGCKRDHTANVHRPLPLVPTKVGQQVVPRAAAHFEVSARFLKQSADLGPWLDSEAIDDVSACDREDDAVLV